MALCSRTTGEESQEAFAAEEALFSQEPHAVPRLAWVLGGMFSQALPLSYGRSCAAAVARVLVLSTTLGRRSPSEDTAGSCRARTQGPARVLQRLTYQASDRLELDVAQAWLGHRHRSHVQPLDGGMPPCASETKENQQA